MANVKRNGDETYASGESFLTGSSAAKERREALMNWLLTPKDERHPTTKKAFAETWGVSEETIRRDTKDPAFQKDFLAMGAEINKIERVTDVMDALYRHAVDPGQDQHTTPASRVTAGKVWLEQVAKNTDNAALKDLSDASDEELGAMALEILEKLSGR